MKPLEITVLPHAYAICLLAPYVPAPDWAVQSEFYSVTRTADELSIVCVQDNVPSDIQAERNWRVIKVQGPLDFSLTGVLASLTAPLSQAQISIFALSTYTTDYLMVRGRDLNRALDVLTSSGAIVY